MSKVDGHNRFFVTACAGFFVLLALIGIQALFDAEKNSAKLLPAPSSHATQSISSADRELLELTEAETNYLAQLGTITVCPDPDWIPFEHVDESGNFTGIAADLLKVLETRLGLEFTYVFPVDWNDALARSKNGEVHILPFLNKTPDREKWLTFTDPLLVDPSVFITHHEHPFISDPKRLTDKIMILPDGTSIAELVKRDFPHLTIISVPTENEVFQALEHRSADLTLRSLIISAYTIRKEGLFNLKIAGQAHETYTNHLRMGVLKGHEMLRDILNRGIASISQRERDEIINRHINITVVNPIDYGPLAYVTFLFAALIAVSLFWNYKLNNTYRALNESERSKSVLLANLPGIAYRCHDDEQWTMEFISDGCQKLTGYPSSDFIDNRRISYNEVIHNDDREWVRAAWNKAKEAKKDSINLTYRIITADKEVKWVFEQGMFIYDENASIAALEGLVIDISDQKNAEKEREELLSRLQKSLAEVKTLRGIVPICASCKNIRDDAGFWNRVETYVSQHTGAEFSHSICPNCMKKLYPEYCEKCESTDKKQPNES